MLDLNIHGCLGPHAEYNLSVVVTITPQLVGDLASVELRLMIEGPWRDGRTRLTNSLLEQVLK